MAFYVDSLLSFRSSENKHEKQLILKSSQQKQTFEYSNIDKQPNRELSSFLLNELRANDFFQDTYVASAHSLELEYDLDELISLSKQMQQKHNPAINIRDGQPCRTEGDHRTLKRNHQPVAEKCVSPRSSVLKHEPYSLLGYSVKASTRRSARLNVTPLKCKPQQPVSTVQCTLNSGNGLFSGTRVTRPKLWSHIERPVPKKHSCVMLPVRRPVKKSVLNLNKSTDYYRFEETHPNIELVQSDTLFPKRVARMEAKTFIDLCSSEFSEETCKESTASKIESSLDTKEPIEKEGEVRNPTWHDVLEQKLGGVPKINVTHDKEVQIDLMQEIPQEMEQAKGSQHNKCFYEASRAANTIQVLPPLNIRRECRIQKLPDVSIASGDGFMSSNGNNNAYIEVVYIKQTDISESTNPSSEQQNMQPEDSDSKLYSNPYLHPLANVIADSEDEASEDHHNEEDRSSQKSNSEERYSTSFEMNSSLHDSMTSQPITDDEKASLVEHSRSKSKLQIVSPPVESKSPQTDKEVLSKTESQSSQSTNSLKLSSPDTQRLQLWENERLLTKPQCRSHASSLISNGLSRKSSHSTKTTSESTSLTTKSVKNLKTLESPQLPKRSSGNDIQSVSKPVQNEIEDEDFDIEVPALLEATPVISTAFLKIIDQIVESSPEDQIAAVYLDEHFPNEATCTDPTIAFGKSVIFEMVHENWAIQPDRTQIDSAVQTFATTERTNFQNSAVQTDPCHMLNDHWEADSIASAHMVFDRIRNDKIDHWQQQTDNAVVFRHEPCMPPMENGTQTSVILQPTAKHQSVQYSPPSPVKPQSRVAEINVRPRQFRRRPVAHSPPESSSSLSGVDHYTPITSHRQHLSPSERLKNYKQFQHHNLQFQENPKVLRTIESIRNEAAEGNIGHRRSLNSTYRSAYEEDDIEIAAQRFLISVNKERILKQRTQTYMDYNRTESSSTQGSSSVKFYSLDGTPSSESASQMDDRFLCTNSEPTPLSVNRSPISRCLSFRSSGNEMSIVRSARKGSLSGRSALKNVSPRKPYLITKAVARGAPATSSFETNTTSSSIEDSAGKIKCMRKDDVCGGLQQNSTSSSIEKQMVRFRLTEETDDRRVSADKHESTDQQFTLNQTDSNGLHGNYIQQLTDPQRSTELERSTNQNRFTEPKSSSDNQSSIDFQSSADQHSSADRHTFNRNADADRSFEQPDNWTNQFSTSSSLERQMTKMAVSDVAIINGNSHSDIETSNSFEGGARKPT